MTLIFFIRELTYEDILDEKEENLKALTAGELGLEVWQHIFKSHKNIPNIFFQIQFCFFS